MCVEHHHDADELVRQAIEFRRERRNEGREVPLFVGAEAAGRDDPCQVGLMIHAIDLRHVFCRDLRAGAK